MMHQPKRRWYHFTLWSLFFVIFVCAIACSWFAAKIRHARSQRDAVRVIQHFGGITLYDYELAADGLPLETPEPPAPQWLLKLLGKDFFAHVVYVLPPPEYLDVPHFSLDDSGMAYLESLPKLKCLSLRRTKVTDAGLVHLRDLCDLQELDLSNTTITNGGLSYLTGLSGLEQLHLRHTQVTDAGVAHLHALRNLKILGIEQTRVTDDGVFDLQRALPRCLIYR